MSRTEQLIKMAEDVLRDLKKTTDPELLRLRSIVLGWIASELELAGVGVTSD